MRLVSTSAPMCPRFHTDHVGVRLICTYVGPGTEWLPFPTDEGRVAQHVQQRGRNCDGIAEQEVGYLVRLLRDRRAAEDDGRAM